MRKRFAIRELFVIGFHRIRSLSWRTCGPHVPTYRLLVVVRRNVLGGIVFPYLGGMNDRDPAGSCGRIGLRVSGRVRRVRDWAKRHIVWLSAILISIGIEGVAFSSPEYIAADTPAGTPLTEVRSATSNIGTIPELTYPSLQPPLGRALQRLRSRLPKTGTSLIDDAVFTAAPRFYYRYRDNLDGSISEALAGGGAMVFESGWAYDFFQIGFAGYSSLPFYGPDDRGGTGLLRPIQENYSVLGQAYANFKTNRTAATIGRALIDLPYLNANDSRMTPNTFETVALRSKELENLQIGLGYVGKMRFRNESTFESMSERAGAPGTDKGVGVAAVRWNVTDNYQVSLVEQYGWDMFNTLYAESERSVELGGDFTLKLGAQFTDQRSVGDALVGDFDSQHVGAKAALGHGNLTALVSATWTSDGDGIRKPWGGSPSYNSVMISDFDRGGERSVRFGISRDLSDLLVEGLSATGYYVYGDGPGGDAVFPNDQREVGVTVDYQFSEGILENFWIRGRTAWNDRIGGEERADYRLILNYSFQF